MFVCVCEWGEATHTSMQVLTWGLSGGRPFFEHGTLVDPLHCYSWFSEAKNGILPLSLCKHKPCCWTTDLGVVFLTAGFFSCVCQWRDKSLSPRVVNFIDFFRESFTNISRDPVAVQFVLSLVVFKVTGHTQVQAHTNTTEHELTRLSVTCAPWLFDALLLEHVKK